MSFTAVAEAFFLRVLRRKDRAPMQRWKARMGEIRERTRTGYPLAERRVRYAHNEGLWIISTDRPGGGREEEYLDWPGTGVQRELYLEAEDRFEWVQNGKPPIRFFPVLEDSRRGLRKDDMRVSVTPGLLGGRPHLVGRRIDTQSLAWRLRSGHDGQEIMEEAQCEALDLLAAWKLHYTGATEMPPGLHQLF